MTYRQIKNLLDELSGDLANFTAVVNPNNNQYILFAIRPKNKELQTVRTSFSKDISKEELIELTENLTKNLLKGV